MDDYYEYNIYIKRVKEYGIKRTEQFVLAWLREHYLALDELGLEGENLEEFLDMLPEEQATYFLLDILYDIFRDVDLSNGMSCCLECHKDGKGGWI